MYSNGRSEIILGKAIKMFDLPREKIVVLTKVSISLFGRRNNLTLNIIQVFYPVGKTTKSVLGVPNLDDIGYVNQRGLSRKVISFCLPGQWLVA
jgi:aryl-alcohol dehydrogenase-like predicted oxidoreductase